MIKLKLNKTALMVLAAVALLSVYVFVFAPLTSRRAEIQEEIEMKYVSMIKLEKFIERTKKTGIKINDAQADLKEMEQYIIQAVDTPLGFAELQGKVQDIAGSAGVRVTSIKPLQPVKHKGYTGLPIYIEGSSDIYGLSKFLNQLDSTWEFISIDSLALSTPTVGSLRIRVQLSGLMRQKQ